MKKVALLGIALVAAVCLMVQAADSECLKEGDAVAAFNVKDITGPSAGKSLCYRCQFGNRPVVGVFTRDASDKNLAKLVSEVDKVVEANKDKKMAAFVVVLTEDADKVAPKLEEIAKQNGIKNVPLTIFDGNAGPEEYKITKDSSTTVMTWSEGKVKTNVALAKGELNETKIKALVTDAGNLVK